MSAEEFTSIMLLIVFGFIAGMIWAYRKNDFQEVKKEVKTETLNSFDATLRSITTISEATIKAEEEKKRKEEEEEAAKQKAADPLADYEVQSRKKLIQNKNHIKKSAADEYFEKTKFMGNDILKPKT